MAPVTPVDANRLARLRNTFFSTVASMAVVTMGLGAGIGYSPGALAQIVFPDDACPTVVADRNLSCVAEDVTIASVDFEPGTLPATCVAGEDITLDIELGFVINANAVRYDIATWIAKTPGDIKLLPDQGGPTACNLLTLSQDQFSDPIPDDLLGQGLEFDPTKQVVDDLDTDACYDITSGSQNFYFAEDFPNEGGITVTCLPNVDAQLTFQTMVSWDQGQAANNCSGGPDDYANILSNSKCKAGDPIVLPIEVQSRLVIEKQTLPDGLLDSFDFSGTTTDPDNGTVAITPFSLSDGGEQVLTAPLQATYSITEAIPPGFAIDSIVCTNQTTMQPANVTVNTATGNVSVTMGGSQFDVRCVYTNDQLPATLTVVKNTNGGNGTFDFEWQSTTNSPATTFQLATAGETASTDILIETGLGDTDFSVTETLTQAQIDAGWVAESVECANSDDLGNPFVTGTVGATGATVGGITLNAGDDVTCTFVNNAAAQFTITKVAQGADADTTEFTITHDYPVITPVMLTPSGGSATSAPVIVPISDSGTGQLINMFETILPGWNLDNIACSGTDETAMNNVVSFTLQPGNIVNCTFTNIQAGQISVIKNTLGGDGSFDFTTDVPGVMDGMFSITTMSNTGSASIATPPPGMYFVTESVPAGWDLTNISCSGATSSTIIYTGAGGGTDAFEPGDTTALIDLAAGEDISCTFTNTQRGAIVIGKQTIPVSMMGDFGFTSTSGPTTIPPSFTVTAGGQELFNDMGAGLLAGTYTVTEDNPAPGFDLTAINCIESISPGPNLTTVDVDARTATINLDPGELVTCNFVNTERANLVIAKAVTVDGPANSTFSFSSNTLPDPTFDLGPVTAAMPATVDYLNLAPGTYDVAEDELAALADGWALVDSSCSDGSTVNSIDLAPGEDVVCTFTNAPLGSATIIKNSVGGTGLFNYTGTAPFLGLTLDTSMMNPISADFTNQLDPLNNPYVIVEEDPAPDGFALTSLTCDELGGTDATGAPVADNTTTTLGARRADINADYNEQVTCTFVNTADGSITIRKQTAPDAVDQLFDFTSAELNLTGSIRDFDIAAEELVLTAQPGTYSSTETVPAGWQITGISCMGQTASTVTYTGATESPTDGFELGDDTVNVTLAAGENVVCEFTNTQESSIQIVKSVVGPGGTFNFGSAELGSFMLTPADNDIAQADFPGLLPGTYMVAETPVPAGYMLTQIECLGQGDSIVTIGAMGGFDPGDTGVTIQLAPGENLVCGFENTATGSITVAKATLPAGSAVPFTFEGDAAGSITDGQTIPVSGLLPGTYTSTELAVAGWDLVDINCDDAMSATPSTGDTGTGVATFNVDPGEDVTCAFTNVQRGSVTIIKNVLNDNGGNAVVGEFGIMTSAGALTFDGGTVNGDTTTYTATVPNVVPNTGYTVSETPATGYTPGTWFCRDDTGPVLEDAGAATGATFTVNPGKDVICEITNDDAAPTITLIKSVLNNNGGNAGPDDFGISVGGNVVVSGATTPVAANTPIAIDEAGLAGYTFVSITGDAQCPAALGGTVTLNEGDAITCTITNDDVAPTITLIKNVLNNNGGNAGPDDFGISVGGNVVVSGATTDVSANTPIAIDEAGLTGYTFVSITGDPECPAALGGTVTLDEGDAITCTITNDDVAPTLTLTKVVENNFNGTLGPNDFGISVGGNVVTSGATLPYDANTALAINETLPPGYQFLSITGDAKCPAALGGTVTLDEGENVSCTITNQDIAPDINLAKTVNGPATLEADGTYTVVYTIAATNNSQGIGVYNLVDTFSPAGGITLNSATIVYGGGETQTGMVTSPFTSGATVVMNEGLGIGESETWTVTANFTVDPAVLDPADRVCLPGNPVINTGFYNAVSGVDTEGNVDDNDTCTSVPDPAINLAKTVNGPATLEMDGTFTVVYTVTATNSGEGPGLYDIVDTFSPANGVTLNTAEIVYGGGETQTVTPTSPFMSGDTVVSGEPLAGNASETWTITANFTVDPAVVDPADRACDPGNPVINTGFYNAVAGVDMESNTDDNDTCTEIPAPEVNLAKSVDGPATLEMDGTYTVVYTITATNSGQGPGAYDIVDTFSPANGITLNTAEIAYGGGETQTVTPISPFNSGDTVVTGEPLASGASETWTVTANFTVDPAVLVPAEGMCDPGDPVINTGFYNAVSGVDMESNTDDNDTCTGVPDPSINLAKTLVGPAVTEPDGTFTVEYTITATNNGDGPGVYDLVDTFSLPNGVTVNTAEIVYAGGETQTVTPTSPFMSGDTVVSGEPLAGGGASESWTVTANFTVDPVTLTPADSTCDPADPVANTGFYNAVAGVDEEADTSDNDTCTDIPRVDITVLAGVCINDVPYISWDIATTGIPNADTATVRVFGDGGNGGTDPADYVNLLETFADVPFSGQALWPGAAVDAMGNGTDWPGWDFVDGQWVEDPTDERVPTILVEFEVNPTTSAIVAYPPQSAACVPPQDLPQPPALPVPVDGKWALWLLTLLMLATGLYFGPRTARRR